MRSTANKVKQFVHAKPSLFTCDPTYQLRSLRHAPDMCEVIYEIKRAFEAGIEPEKCDHATTRAFFLKDKYGVTMGVFKLDYYIKEYATYRLDHDNFAGVPPTIITTFSHPLFKGEATGSLQLFVPDAPPAVEVDRKEYTLFQPEPIRRVAQLDIRTLNPDRHTSNLLIKNNRIIVPIDHGFTFPGHASYLFQVWVNWEQAETPFSPEELAYIANLDPEQDRAYLIEDIGLDQKPANHTYLATLLLKQSVDRGLTPAQIGNLISTRHHSDGPSAYQTVVFRLLERNAHDWATFTSYANQEIQTLLDDYAAYQQEHLSATG